MPVATVQWESLIAVSYAARPYGVKRGMTAKEAKRLCPPLRLCHVESLPQPSSVSEKTPQRPRSAAFIIFYLLFSHN